MKLNFCILPILSALTTSYAIPFHIRDFYRRAWPPYTIVAVDGSGVQGSSTILTVSFITITAPGATITATTRQIQTQTQTQVTTIVPPVVGSISLITVVETTTRQGPTVQVTRTVTNKIAASIITTTALRTITSTTIGHPRKVVTKTQTQIKTQTLARQTTTETQIRTQTLARQTTTQTTTKTIRGSPSITTVTTIPTQRPVTTFNGTASTVNVTATETQTQTTVSTRFLRPVLPGQVFTINVNLSSGSFNTTITIMRNQAFTTTMDTSTTVAPSRSQSTFTTSVQDDVQRLRVEDVKEETKHGGENVWSEVSVQGL